MQRLTSTRSLALGFGAMLLTSFVLAAAPANAQVQEKPQQKCIVTANKNVAKLVKAWNKDVTNCIKNGGKNKTEKMGNQDSIDVCTTLDVKGKIAKAEAKMAAKLADKCPADPNSPDAPDFGTHLSYQLFGSDLATALIPLGDKTLALAAALFGSSLDTAIVRLDKVTDKQDENPTNTKLEGKCQTEIIKNAGKCLDTKWKIYNKCKKNALKGKSGPPIEDASGLEACVASTPADAKVVKTCVTKLGAKMTKKCGEVDLGTVIPNAGAANPGEVATYIDERVECLFCWMVNDADNLNVDCDLFDDGFANASCGGLLGIHKCVLDPNDSGLLIDAALLDLNADLFGAIDINCGEIDAHTGKAPCECDIQELAPFELGGIGFICLTPGTEPCATGEIDCNGGNALDWDLVTDHNVGACTGNPDCDAQCDDYCGNLGKAKADDGACEGFCEGGVSDGLACTDDDDCVDGACNGGNLLPHGNICGCQCISLGGAPSRAGGLACQIPTEINVEVAPPCGDGDVFISIGTSCVNVSTETTTSTNLNDNNDPNGLSRSQASFGSPADCSALITSVTSGTTLAGVVTFFDSALGDLLNVTTFTCQ